MKKSNYKKWRETDQKTMRIFHWKNRESRSNCRVKNGGVGVEGIMTLRDGALV